LKSILSGSKSKPNEQRTRNELVVRVLSTYGNPHLCGITEIELFNESGIKIPLTASSIMIRNLGHGTKYLIDKMINGHKLTTDDKQMWIGYLPKPPLKLEIVLFFNKQVELGGVKIWNYNKSIIDFTKGIKEVECILNDNLVWNGKIDGAKGKSTEDYST
jgi:hypothetical protein